MNAAIVRLFALTLVLFALLVAFTSRWTVFEAEGLRAERFNQPRQLIKDQRVRRGLIRAADGTLLARSVAGGAGTFRRAYPPAARLAAHVVGYSYVARGRASLEASRNAELTGESTALTSVLDDLRGRAERGDDVITTLDLSAQRAALQALGGRRGSVVAIEPRTGRVRVMASVPGFDPAELRDAARFRALQRGEGSPLFNRATQSSYPPGSTFKVVTAAAALDGGGFRPDSIVDGSSPKTISGVPLRNFGGRSFGPIDLTTALTNSVNTVWAQVAVRLGKERMGEYMRRFGFYAKPPLDYPRAQLFASGEYRGATLLAPGSDRIDVGRMAIGQDKLQVTPLQMAMVASAVANRGRLMKPTLTRRVVDPDGRTVEDVAPEEQAEVMSPTAAGRLRAMMENVVREGTGTQAALAGIDVAGKTGTAEIIADQDLNQPWFIGFAPAGRPIAAVAVTVERVPGGQGGTVAAPIAKAVLQELAG